MRKSRKWILTLLLLVATSALFEAKAQQPAKFQFGIGGALTSSFKNNPQRQLQAGYRGGGFVRYNFSKRFFSLSGLNYVSDKTKISTEILRYDQTGQSATLVAKETFSWLEIPMQGNYIFYSGSHAKFFISGGISIRYLIDANATVTLSSSSAIVSGPSVSTIDNYNRMNYLATSAIGCQLPLTSSNPLLISLSVEHTMRDITRLLEPTPNSTFTYSTIDSDLRITTVALNVALILK